MSLIGFVFTWYSVLILPKPRRLLSTHTTVKLFTLSLPHVNTAHGNQRLAGVHFEAKQNKTNIKKKKKKKLITFSFFFFLAIIPLANNGSFVLYKEECEHKCDGNIFFLSWIKNFTLDCTRYYDKLFTYSDINFFLKAATDTMYFIFSNNTQTILAVGLGTCQEGKNKKDFYAENCIRLPAISKRRLQW